MFYKQVNYLLIAVTVCLAISIIFEILSKIVPFARDYIFLAACVALFIFGIRLSQLIKNEKCFQEGIVRVHVAFKFILIACGFLK